MIEIDLHRTRDGAIVVHHDERPRGLRGPREIGDATLAELRALDVGGGESMPTLDEVLDAFGARIPFNLEIKCGGAGPYPGLEEQLLAALAARGLGETILFSSFSDAVLARLRQAAPEARIGVLVERRGAARWRERCAAVGAEAVHLWKGLAEADTVDAAHAAGLAVHVYTVDAPAEMRTLVGRGVDGLFTNRPARMREVLAERAGRPSGESESGSE
jgi:glycerophosphoryl diester phosphodiesterase